MKKNFLKRAQGTSHVIDALFNYTSASRRRKQDDTSHALLNTDPIKRSVWSSIVFSFSASYVWNSLPTDTLIQRLYVSVLYRTQLNDIKLTRTNVVSKYQLRTAYDI